MKKILAGVMSAALATVTCVGFAACGEGDIISEEVTAEEWHAAFAQENLVNGKYRYVTSWETNATDKESYGKGKKVYDLKRKLQLIHVQ